MTKVTKAEVNFIRRRLNEGDDFYEDAPEYVEILLSAVRSLERQGAKLSPGYARDYTSPKSTGTYFIGW